MIMFTYTLYQFMLYISLIPRLFIKWPGYEASCI